jgi:hypothetical protein
MHFQVVLWTLLLLEGYPARPTNEHPIGLVAAREPGGKSADINLQITGDATTIAVPLYLRHTGTADLTDVRLFASLNDASGQPVGGLSVVFQVNGADIPPAGLKIPSNQQVLVTLRANNATVDGTFTGSVVAEHKGEVTRLVSLTLERYPVRILKIAGVTDATGIKLAPTRAAFRHPFHIESTNQGPIKALRRHWAG